VLVRSCALETSLPALATPEPEALRTVLALEDVGGGEAEEAGAGERVPYLLQQYPTSGAHASARRTRACSLIGRRATLLPTSPGFYPTRHYPTTVRWCAPPLVALPAVLS